MKAWHCCHLHIGDSDLLVFAETRNKARKAALDAGLWGYEYASLTAYRAHDWDDMPGDAVVIETNEGISADFPDFYNNEAW